MSSIIFTKDLKNTNSFGINEIIKKLKIHINSNSKERVEIINLKNNFDIYKKIKKSKIVHIHGCWSLSHFKIFLFSLIHNKKIFFSPHGMLLPNALKFKKIRKMLALCSYQKLVIAYSNKIIVNSETEKKELKKIYNHKNIYVIPHGIEVNNKKSFKKNCNKIKIIFFSRIHPIKGLFDLVKIWKNSNILNKFKLDIYGTIEDNNYFSNVKKFLSNNVRYHGPLDKTNKYKTLKKYNVLIYPSFSENFGLVILEALNSGLYILMRNNLPWNFLP